MENAVECLQDRKIIVSAEQKGLVKSIVFPGCTDGELALYLFECERRGVHPLDRLIFPVSRNDKDSGGKKITFQCSIDYFRAEASDTGEYDGQDEPIYGPANSDGYPEYATVLVYKKGIERPITGTARWSEFYPGDKMGFMWKKMPYHMLAKCAEVLALRKAFPKRLSGLYIPEEMQSPETGKPPVQPPQKKAAAAPAGSQTITAAIKDVTGKEGQKADGQKFTKYTITDDKGVAYGTFDAQIADIANTAKEKAMPVNISFVVGKFGNDIKSFELIGAA